MAKDKDIRWADRNFESVVFTEHGVTITTRPGLRERQAAERLRNAIQDRIGDRSVVILEGGTTGSVLAGGT